MGLSSAMDWWDEWKLRILVLCSLSMQLFLCFAPYVRILYNLRRLRVMVWIAYIGGDALAIYALATLFNRQKQHQTGGGGDDLEVIWAPVLLIHLGGQTSITAYSLEDNELWKRHTITLVSQVTVALYVFCKWWSGQKRLLQAAVLLFIAGILRFSEKPWALRRASFQTKVSTIVSPPICTYFHAMATRPPLELEAGQRAGDDNDDVSCSLDEYVKQALEHVNQQEAGGQAQQDEAKEEENRLMFPRETDHIVSKVFVDQPVPYSVRLRCLQFFLKLDLDHAHADRHLDTMLFVRIQEQFIDMYTKGRSRDTCLGRCLEYCLVPGLVLASMVLFAKSAKDGYNRIDITLTNIIFSTTFVIELLPMLIPLLLLPLMALGRDGMCHSWHQMVSQQNVMLFCARRKKKPGLLMKLAAASTSLSDYVNKHWYIGHEPAARWISRLVRQHALHGWKTYIRDPATYRRFSNLRGEMALSLSGQQLLEQQQLGWSFNLPFDERVLLWHLATDLCCFTITTRTPSSTPPDDVDKRRLDTRIISNYMIYLLFICPDMLILGAREDLFVRACDEIELIMTKQDEPSSSPSMHDDESIARRILGMEQGDDLMKKAPIISSAHRPAKALIHHLNEEQMWKVIQGVWVEMLCYSASRCRGYEHAKYLAHGGEYFTSVWLICSFMGMETLHDKVHTPIPPEPFLLPDEEKTIAAAPV